MTRWLFCHSVERCTITFCFKFFNSKGTSFTGGSADSPLPSPTSSRNKSFSFDFRGFTNEQLTHRQIPEFSFKPEKFGLGICTSPHCCLDVWKAICKAYEKRLLQLRDILFLFIVRSLSEYNYFNQLIYIQILQYNCKIK